MEKKNPIEEAKRYVANAKNILHLAMGYDGNRYKNVCEAGFDLANAIIDRCAALYKA